MNHLGCPFARPLACANNAGFAARRGAIRGFADATDSPLWSSLPSDNGGRP